MMVKHSEYTSTVDIEEVIQHSPKTQTVGYVRVSSFEQNIERQLANSNLDKLFIDRITGSTLKRPALNDLFDYVREGDTVITHEIDRLARDLSDLIEIANRLKKKGVTLKIIKENLTFSAKSENPMDTMIFHIFGAIAQYERSKIKWRQREGIEIAKKKGKYKGRPHSLTKEKVAELKTVLEQKNSNLESFKKISYAQIAKDFGISSPTLWRYRKEVEEKNQEREND